jgi:hypothetical protein
MGPNLNINQKNIREKTIKKLLIFFLKKTWSSIVWPSKSSQPAGLDLYFVFVYN